MATHNTAKMDPDLHKRIIFIQKISPETTKQSLEDYFSKYPIERCTVPRDETGKSKMHAIITFQNEESVNAVLSQRVHQIDGKEVFIHRSIPTERSSKDNYGTQQLIVSGLRNQSLIESDIREHFSYYGTICNISNMNNDDNIWVIDFDNYDSVNRILSVSRHCIRGIDVNVKKGDQNIVPRRRSSTPGPTPKTDNNNHSDVISKISNSKHVTMNEQISCLSLPAKKYCIHITNLPANIDAETLTKKFDWDIYDIVMDPAVDDSGASSTQCWLRNANDETEVDKFVRYWNRRVIGGSTIQCEKEEDELELCNKFQFGRCRKSNDECHWEHVECTAQGNCASTCPYGHTFGMKSERDSPISMPATAIDYRIKLTGFETQVTPQNLIQRIGLNNYYVDRKNDRVGYAVKIKTLKYARQLMSKWHDKDIDGQKIKCQLELNLKPFARYNCARSRTASIDEEAKHHRHRSRSRDARSTQSSQETSDLEDRDNIMSTISSGNGEVHGDRRICDKASNDITRTLSKISLNHASSSESITTGIDKKYRLPSDVPSDEWELTNKASNSDGKVLLIRSKMDRKHLAVIKIYPNQASDDVYREIIIMKDLKDVKGVSKLIEPENASNNLVQRRAKRENLWMIMERAPGCSLKEFIERKCQGVLEISTAIKLTLNLIGIIQQMHNKGTFHQNLSPENIMIEGDLKSSIDHAQLTLLNFSQAVIVSNITHTSIPSSTEKWYHAPQIDDQGLSSTVDPSGSCAILFWLLTQIDPGHNNDELPHQQARDKLDDMIKSAVKSTNTNRQIALEEQLKRYLIDAFDRAFGYPHHYPWTINDLECRLKSILQLLTPIEPKLNTIDGIFQELISISDSLPTPPITVHDAQRNAFEKASKAFCQAKKHFLEKRQDQYQWSDGHCTWVHSPHSLINECHNDDVLTYYSFRGRMPTPYSVIITCLGRSSEEGRVMTLFISSNVNGKTIQVPIGQYSTAQDYATIVQQNFVTELTNMLLAIYKERKPI